MLVDWQTISALAIVAVAVYVILRRTFFSKASTGCGSCQACPGKRTKSSQLHQLNS